MNIINIAETFFSIQGEGKTAGVPAVFLRLSGCNLNCKNFSYVDAQNNHLGCDSKHLWMKSNPTTLEYLLQSWQQKGWLQKFDQGVHLVITGGEPLLQQVEIQQLIALVDQQRHKKPFIEIETNATLKINKPLLDRLNQINASPKLTSSGNARQKSYNLETLHQLSQTNKTIFKFVILKKDDITEILHEYVEPLKLDPTRIWLMPEGCSIDALQQKTPMILEWCKKYHMNYSPRLQVFLNVL